jgi:SAM-dependent methyltransferase
MDNAILTANPEQLRQRWQRTNSDDYDAMTAQMNRYLAALDDPLLLLCHGNVLELATGTGRMLAKIKALPQVKLAIGLDLAPQMLRSALAKGHNNLIRAYAEQLPISTASFDTVVCTFYSLRDMDRPPIYREMARILRPGGQFGFTLRNYYVAFLESLWQHFIRQGDWPNSLRTLDGADGVTLDLTDINKEVAAIELAGLRVKQIKTLRFLPFLRKFITTSYWSGRLATKFGSDVIIVTERP